MRYFAAIFLILLLSVGYVAYDAYMFLHTPVEQPGVDLDFTVERGATFDRVVWDLKKAGLITDVKRFQILGRYKKALGSIKAGDYILNTSLTPPQVLEQLIKGQAHLVRLTLREGLPWWETARAIEKQGFATYEDFKEVIHDPDFLARHAIPFDTAEGFLFPDTYLLNKPKKLDREQAEYIASLLVRTFWQKNTPFWRLLPASPAPNENFGTSVNDITSKTQVSSLKKLAEFSHLVVMRAPLPQVDATEEAEMAEVEILEDTPDDQTSSSQTSKTSSTATVTTTTKGNAQSQPDRQQNANTSPSQQEVSQDNEQGQAHTSALLLFSSMPSASVTEISEEQNSIAEKEASEKTQKKQDNTAVNDAKDSPVGATVSFEQDPSSAKPVEEAAKGLSKKTAGEDTTPSPATAALPATPSVAPPIAAETTGSHSSKTAQSTGSSPDSLPAPSTKPLNQPSGTLADKPAHTPADKPSKKSDDASPDESSGKTPSNPVDKLSGKPLDNLPGKSSDKASNKVSGESSEGPLDKSSSKPSGKASGNSAEPSEKAPKSLPSAPASTPAPKDSGKATGSAAETKNLSDLPDVWPANALPQSMPKHPPLNPSQIDKDALRQALTLASLVEKETGLPTERPRVAGVYTNRIHKNMLLQCDPTIIYGIGPSFSGPIRRSQLNDASNLYNTYIHPGLPPSPICSFGIDAFASALLPEKHGYLYFVATGHGKDHTFSKTLREHNRAVSVYRARIRKK